MEAVDNPSYFSVPGGSTSGTPASTSRGPFSLLKRRGANISRSMGANTSSASCTSSSLGHNSAPTTPTAPEVAATPLLPSAPVPLSSHSHHRRSFRSILRSMSANHHHGSAVYQLQHQLLVLGEPRPSDMAPESPCLPHHQLHHPSASSSSPNKEDHHHQRRRSNSNKSFKSQKSSVELLNTDMVYCPIPRTPSSALASVPKTAASEELLGGSPEEVFLSNGDARYYNLTAAMTIPLPGSNAGSGRRRHSIGTFLNRDRGSYSCLSKTPTATTTPTAEEENAPATRSDAMQKMSTGSVGSRGKTSSTGGCSPPDWRHLSAADVPRSAHSRRRCNRCCNVKGSRAADMDDILIVSSNQSQAAASWVDYLKVCFDQINKTRKRPPFKMMCVSLEDVVGPQVVPLAIEEKMTHVKLQIVIICPQFLHHIYENPGPATTLGRLLQPDRVLAMLLGVDESTVTEQHRAALISYQQWHHIPVKDQDESFVSKFLQEALDMMARVWRQQTLRTDRALFSVIPKKVKEGQHKVIVLLNEPIEKEDKLKITVDKNGEHLEVSSVKRRNPYTLHFQMPESCLEVSMLVSVHVEKNGQALGHRQVKCESRMRELDQILRSCDNPLEFMCQTLGFSPGDREHLDNFLVLAFQRNLPPHFNLLHVTGHPHHHRTHTSPEEYPTLLHFAARNGLEKLAWQLLECPGGEHACEIRNACELTPAEMAEAAGHSKLANALRGYMQMTEFTSMYSYMKIMSEGKAKSSGFNDIEYHQPRPLSETYQVPPAARVLMDHYQVPPTARPYCPPGNEMGYMEMHPPAPLFQSPASSFRNSLSCLNTAAVNSEAPATTVRSPSPVCTSPKSDGLDHLTLEEEKLPVYGGAKKSREQIHHQYGAQEELAEILYDFKNNVFSIAEVERFVENWQNRNDVKQSFKDKQEQLNHMREEYEHLQQRMKESMKRPTPFDRIRKLFRGKPKETKESSASCPGDGTKTSSIESMPVCQRPSSSLSLHSISSSSSSSGRMSTVSACSGTSLGDSGTHSDPEDRKMLSSPTDARNCGNGVKFGIQNYEIPPAPRPLGKISSPHYTAGSTLQQTTPSCAPSNISIEIFIS
ncbi:phosphoinositide 3-kinase adapter protein 1 isoform X3 [Zootermopsis nevadensis]|uniref:phosphoinositide 3-kinase adapter protein 1 isoform X3 n=1 Tax=Zootermopsis nevadensis TaxID=136037 RepID=UPI000B8ED730|nr:phosphoinositide 3-kinase adapter protein 1 isoform X3 [Zootermopsis nevadensis]